MQIEIKITVGSPAELASVAERLAAVRVVDERVISFEDRPDVGKEPEAPVALAVPPAPPAADPAVAFAGVSPTLTAAVPLAPTPTVALVPPAPPALAVPPAPPVAPVPPAPPAAAPAETAAGTPPSAATAPTAAPERDSSGLVWDPRIHASTKSKKQDGTWTAKRGVDDALRATVEAELRGLPPPQATAAAPAAPAVPPAPPVGVTVPATPVVTPQAPVPPAPPVADVAQAPAAPAASPTTFSELLARIGPALAAKPTEANQLVVKCCQHPAVNVPSLGSFAANPTPIPVFWELYKAEVATLGINL